MAARRLDPVRRSVDSPPASHRTVGAARHPDRPRRRGAGRRSVAALAGAAVLGGLSSCASVEFTRETETSGRFRSSGAAASLFSYDFPERAIDIARENASDSRQPNMLIEDEWVFPYLGPLDFLLDIIGVRYARVTGTWGFVPTDESGAPAK